MAADAPLDSAISQKPAQKPAIIRVVMARFLHGCFPYW
jgi:hypothetical protein